MIKIVAKQFVKPDQIANYIELMDEMVSKTRALDAGCIEYGLFQDLEVPHILTIIEEWESQEALDNHMQASHFKEIVPKLDAYYEKPGDVNFYRPAEYKR
ncbi:putative quinol monooxygenase [Paenibacillus sp. HW567]|uniref:putative quinol monooxygenase n=1 Tax=Paenibacillus sp. HW567 TaxID=1034769 RepID=UPI00037662E0|nr:putative quinol monooxygenase [Paenibacillus sp. HW567]